MGEMAVIFLGPEAYFSWPTFVLSYIFIPSYAQCRGPSGYRGLCICPWRTFMYPPMLETISHGKGFRTKSAAMLLAQAITLSACTLNSYGGVTTTGDTSSVIQDPPGSSVWHMLNEVANGTLYVGQNDNGTLSITGV